MPLDQLTERRRPEQRNIARQQDQRSARPPQVRFRLQQRMAGSQLWLLQCKPQARPFPDRALDILRLVADNRNDCGGLERLRRPEHPLDQRQFSRTVEHFGQRGLHARTFSCRENHNMQI